MFSSRLPAFGVEQACGSDSATSLLGAAVLPGMPQTSEPPHPRGSLVARAARRERELDFAMDAVFEPEDER